MKITIIGAGYVGLVSGACLSQLGFEVTCVDCNQEKILSLQQGVIPIYEPGLEELIAANAHRLNFTTDISNAVSNSDAIFIAVGTPASTEDGRADLKYVKQVAAQIAPHLKPGAVVINKSTVPVGTARLVYDIILNHRQAQPKSQQKREIHGRPERNLEQLPDFSIASNPEFLREGSAIKDFMHPDRIVIGCEDDNARHILAQIYRPLTEQNYPLLFTSLETAELIKYAANSFLATKISFINEIADLAEKCNGDINDIATGIGLDQRIGKQFLQAGPGYGGSCFPKDVTALLKIAESYGVSMQIVNAAHQANHQRKQKMVNKITKLFGGKIAGLSLGVLGVTFKANTDDIRDSISLDLIPRLQRMGAKIKAYDPAGMTNGGAALPEITWCNNAYHAAERTDALIILTEWDEFKSLDFSVIYSRMRQANVIDLRNICCRATMAKLGFNYVSIGYQDIKESAKKTLEFVA